MENEKISEDMNKKSINHNFAENDTVQLSADNLSLEDRTSTNKIHEKVCRLSRSNSKI